MATCHQPGGGFGADVGGQPFKLVFFVPIDDTTAGGSIIMRNCMVD
jgi:hypothetical protein